MSPQANTTKTEGGILNGIGPLGIPIQTLIVQIMFIQLLVQILAQPLKLMKQPKVISEIIAGILLGPSAMGRIPGFTENLFHPNAMMILNAIANLGLIFFLFIMGLELDLSLLKRSLPTTTGIALLGMAIPFGFGAAVSVFLFDEFMDPLEVNFPAFLLFVGVATSITAFPVLASILSELNLITDRVGITTLGAAAIGDVVAWMLLALCIAVAAAGNFLNILYIFLMLAVFLLFMGTIVRYLLNRTVKYMLNSQNQVSRTGVLVMSMLCLGASWYTSFIGVHAIFGAFVAGMIVPREGRFADDLTHKIEDFVNVIVLPLYFAYSGIRTDITKINSGMAALGVLLVVIAASAGKIGGSMIAARVTGTKSWRECAVLGIFMNCKGLVEIIILNIGLDAGVLNQTTFAIMVLLALITTFATTPLVLWIYPPEVREAHSTEKEREFQNDAELHPLLAPTSYKCLKA